MSTAYVKHMPMATTIRQDLTRPGSNLLMLIAAISHGAQKNHGGATLGTWHPWHRAKHAAGGVNIGNDLDGIWGSKPTSWVVCYMVGNYPKLGSSSHIPECAKFKANTLEGARKYIS